MGADGRGAHEIKKNIMGVSKKKKRWAAPLFSKVHFFAPMILVSLICGSWFLLWRKRNPWRRAIFYYEMKSASPQGYIFAQGPLGP